MYASPISRKIENRLNSISNETNIVKFLKVAQAQRHSGINFQNVGNYNKNTIEFRTPNGTLNPQIWIENINLFAGIVKSAEELAIIQSKKEDLTAIEQEKIKCYELLKRDGIEERLKLRSIVKFSYR